MLFQWYDPFTLDPYQQEGVDFIKAFGRVFIVLPVGSGKTVLPLKASRDMGVKTITILCLGNSLWTWYRHIQEWRPDLADSMVVIEKFNKAQRTQIWNDPTIKVIIAKVGTFQRDWDVITSVPQMVVCDECQKYMRNRDSKTAEAIQAYAQAAKFCVFTTGTGISRGRQEFFPVLQAIDPKQYRSYWRFVNQYMYTHRGMFGMEILGPRNTPQFREITKCQIFRPQNSITGLPPINRQRLPVEMTSEQGKLYEELRKDMYSYLTSGELLIASNTLAQVTRLRQVLCCPKILDPGIGSYGAGIEAVLDHMQEEEDRRHCVWFTPFTDAIPYMQEALASQGFHSTVVFRHGMDMNDLKYAEGAFRHDSNCVAICSILFSQSFELETGMPGYFIGYSFNPDDNEQAEGRLRRKTTKADSVNMYYLQNLGTYDERTLEILGRKHLNTRVDISDMHALRELIGNQNKPIEPH